MTGELYFAEPRVREAVAFRHETLQQKIVCTFACNFGLPFYALGFVLICRLGSYVVAHGGHRRRPPDKVFKRLTER